MAKFVYLSAPAHGHLNPALPVIRELTRRGEQVIVYNSDEFCAQITRAGAEFGRYPDSDLTSERISTLLQDGNLAQITRLLLGVSETLTSFTVDVLAREHPDAVLFDAIALWGRIAANECRLPTISTIPHFIFDGRKLLRSPPRLLWTLLTWAPAIPGLTAARKRLNQRYSSSIPRDRRVFPMRGGLNLMFTSRDLQPPSPVIDDSFRFVGPSVDPSTVSNELPFPRRPDVPLVYISMGTIHNRSLRFYQTCFEAFETYPAQFLLSSGSHTDIARLRPPSNFIVRASVPQLSVLAAASAFVTHAGMNSVHEGLCFGVPMLLVPHQLEQLFNARVIESRGAGIVMDQQVTGRRVTARALRRGLENLTADERYRCAARQVRSELEGTGGFAQAADEIQRYVASTHTQRDGFHAVGLQGKPEDARQQEIDERSPTVRDGPPRC